MSDNFADNFNNFKKMVDSGNIPPEIQGIVNNFKNSSNTGTEQTLNNILSQVSPEMLNNLSSMFSNSNSSTTDTTKSNHFSDSNSVKNSGMNIDMATLTKITSIVNKMNTNDSASKNLLQSLKPYLRDSRKDKLDQYSNLLNVAQIAELMKNDKSKENN